MENKVTNIVAFDDGGTLHGLLDKAEEFYKSVDKATKAQEKQFKGLKKSIEDTNDALSENIKKGVESAKRVEAIEKSNKRLADSIKKVDTTNSKYSRTLRGVNVSLQRSAHGFKLKSKEALKGAKALAASRVSALAARAAFGLVGLALTALAGAFSKSQKLVDAFSVTMAQGKAVVDVFADRIAGAGETILGLFKGEFSLNEAGKKLKDTFKGVNEELEREIELAGELERINQRIIRDEINTNVRRADANKRLKELNFLIEDTTKSFDERRKAAIEADKIERSLLEAEIELTERKIATQLGQVEVTDDLRERIALFQKEGFAFSEEEKQANKLKLTLDDLGLSLSGINDAQAFADLASQLSQLEATSLEIRTTNNNKLNTINQQQQAQYLKFVEDRKKAEQDLADFRANIANRLLDIEGSQLEGEALIRFQADLAQKEIDNLELVAKEKFAALKRAFDLEEEFAALRLNIEQETTKAISEERLRAARETINKELELKTAELELTKATEEEKLAARIKSLQQLKTVAIEEFGEGSVEALKIDIEINELTDTNKANSLAEALANLDQQQEIALAEVELTKDRLDKQLSLEDNKEKEKLIILKEGLEKRKELLLNSGLLENDPEIQLLDLQIEGLQEQINEVGKLNLSPLDRIALKIKEAFNLSDADFNLITSQVTGIVNNIFSGFDALREERLSKNQQLISEIDAQISELETKLEVEEERARQGHANNADSLRASLEKQTQARKEAEEERLRIEKKAAKQRLIQNALQQASSLTLAVAQLIAAQASGGIIGLVLAAGGVAAIFALAAQAKAQAQEFAQAPEFRDGGSVVDGLLLGDSHEHGGVDAVYKDKRGRKRMINLEGDEFIVNKRDAAKNLPLLEEINAGHDVNWIYKLAKEIPSEGLLFNRDANKILSPELREVILNKPDDNSEMLNKLDRMNEHLHAMNTKSQVVEKDGKFYRVDNTGAVPRMVQMN